VQSRVNAKGCKKLEDFQQAVQDEMRSVPKDMLRRLFSSMPNRMALVIERGGDKTGY
jgi:hypothetical protein